MRLKKLSMLFIQIILPAALVVALAFPADVFAQTADPDHVVSPQAMTQRLADSAATRQQEINTITHFLSMPQVEQAVRSQHANPEQLRKAIPNLSDSELAMLSTRAADAQQKIAAGSFSNAELLIIILIVVIVIIVIVLR